MRRGYGLLMGFLLAVCFVSGAAAQTDSLEMELGDLLNIEVSVASKKTERIGESPGIISIITAERLKELGVTNLLDALSYVPGVSVMETYWREPIITVRGVLESLYNDKVLLLINGLPVFEAVNNASYFESIPIDGIERIEVVRGPGSVLYGTNAFAGVINIVMKTGEKQNGLDIDLSGGSFDRKTVLATYGKKIKNLDYLISLMYSDDDGYPKVFEYDERTTIFAPGMETYTYPYENDIFNIYGSVSYNDIKLFGSYWSQIQNKFGMIPILGFGGPAEHYGVNIGLKYDHKFNDKLSYSGSGRYTYMKRYTRVGYNPDEIVPGWSSGFITFGDHSLYKGSVFTLDNYLTYPIRQNLNIVGGISYEKYLPKNLYTMMQKGEISPKCPGSDPFPPPESENWAAYLQTDYLLDKIRFIGGVRYSDFGRDVSTFTTPRFGIVFNYLQNNYIKLLYGDAFRAPSAFERFVLVPGVLTGTPKLKPEKMSTIEISIDYSIGGKILTKATVFNSKVKDLVVRIPHPVHAMQYANSTDEQVINGIELETEGKLQDNLNLFMNLSYKDADNKATDSGVLYVEKYLANIGIKYSPITPLSIGLNMQYVGDREGELGIGAKPWVGSPGDKVKVHSYTLLNLDTDYKIYKNFLIYLGVKNLLDKEYKFPEHLRRRIDTIPGGHGRNFYIGIRYEMN